MWGGVHQWTYDRPNLSVGERLVHQMDQVGIDMMCIMTSDHRRVYPNDSGPYTPNDFLLEVRKAAPERFALTCSVDPFRDIAASVKEIERCVKDLGFHACKLYPSYDHFDPRGPSASIRFTESSSSSIARCRSIWASLHARTRQ